MSASQRVHFTRLISSLLTRHTSHVTRRTLPFALRCESPVALPLLASRATPLIDACCSAYRASWTLFFSSHFSSSIPPPPISGSFLLPLQLPKSHPRHECILLLILLLNPIFNSKAIFCIRSFTTPCPTTTLPSTTPHCRLMFSSLFAFVL